MDQVSNKVCDYANSKKCHKGTRIFYYKGCVWNACGIRFPNVEVGQFLAGSEVHWQKFY